MHASIPINLEHCCRCRSPAKKTSQSSSGAATTAPLLGTATTTCDPPLSSHKNGVDDDRDIVSREDAHPDVDGRGVRFPPLAELATALLRALLRLLAIRADDLAFHCNRLISNLNFSISFSCC
eukprot:PhM_4_TR7016/c0_g1_i1/m.91176